MIGVYKVRTRGLFPSDPVREVKKLAGVFQQEDFALAFMAGLHQEQMQKIGTILDEYEMRDILPNDVVQSWPDVQS